MVKQNFYILHSIKQKSHTAVSIKLILYIKLNFLVHYMFIQKFIRPVIMHNYSHT